MKLWKKNTTSKLSLETLSKLSSSLFALIKEEVAKGNTIDIANFGVFKYHGLTQPIDENSEASVTNESVPVDSKEQSNKGTKKSAKKSKSPAKSETSDKVEKKAATATKRSKAKKSLSTESSDAPTTGTSERTTAKKERSNSSTKEDADKEVKTRVKKVKKIANGKEAETK